MKERDFSIDFLRATAILLMTITHVNALLYLGNNPILDFFTTAGATLCFSIFLFCSAYVTGLKIQKGSSFTIKDTLNRALEIYMVYVVLGIFVTFVLKGSIDFDIINNIVLLNYVPEFTEFLIAFVLFSFIPLFFSKQQKYLLNNPLILTIITLSIYILGTFVYTQISKYTYPEIVRIPLENIFGYQSLHRFPLTYYLPIYSLGIFLSMYRKRNMLIAVLISSFTLFIVLYSLKLSHWNRWPPSILFLLYGFIYIPLILLVYREFKKFFSKGIFKMFTNIGMYPLEQFFLSTFFVFVAKAFLNPSNTEILSIIVNFLILALLILHPIVFYRKMV